MTKSWLAHFRASQHPTFPSLSGHIHGFILPWVIQEACCSWLEVAGNPLPKFESKGGKEMALNAPDM